MSNNNRNFGEDTSFNHKYHGAILDEIQSPVGGSLFYSDFESSDDEEGDACQLYWF